MSTFLAPQGQIRSSYPIRHSVSTNSDAFNLKVSKLRDPSIFETRLNESKSFKKTTN